MNVRHFLPALALAVASPLPAQSPARLAVTVRDAVTGAPVQAAEVVVGSDRGRTAHEGSVIFRSVPPGRHDLRVRALGYAAAAEAVEVLPGTVSAIEVVLDPLPLELAPLTVTARPTAGQISGEALARRGELLGAALNGWEGIVVRQGRGGAAEPQVRGSAPDEVLVLVDGFPVNDPFTGRADLNRISARDVESVTLLPGAQTARYGGRAVAGVIAVQTRVRLDSEASGRVETSGARGGRLALAHGRASLVLAADWLADGFGYDRPDGRSADRRNAGGSVYRLHARAAGPVDVQARAAWSGRGLPGTVVNPTPHAWAEDRSAWIGMRTAGAWTLHGTAEWIEARARDSAPPPGFVAYDTRTSGWTVSAGAGRAAAVALAGWAGEVSAGVEARHDAYAGDGVRDGARFDRAGLSVGAVLSTHGPSGHWTISPAGRLDWWTGREGPALSGRVDLAWQRGAAMVTAALGNAVTVPALADLLFREGVGIRLNPALRPERVRWEGELGLRLSPAPGGQLALGVRGYYGRVDDLVLWSPDFRFVWSPGNFDVRRRGGEVTVELTPVAGLRLDASSALSIVTFDRPGGAQVRYRPRFTQAAGLGWSPGPWRLDLRWHHVGTRYPNNSGLNPLPPFDLITLGLERRLGMLAVRADLGDLLNARPEWIAGFPTPGRTLSLSLILTPQ